MLLEIIAAVAVVAWGLTAFASGVPIAAMAISEGAQLSTATFLAGARMEEVRAAAWRRFALDSLSFPDEAALPDPHARYARQVRVLDCDVPPGCGAVISPLVRQITVTVTYRPITALGLATSSKTVSLTTLTTQR